MQFKRGPKHVAELDLEKRDRVFNNINKTLESLKDLDVFPSLVWLWCWDIVVDLYENNTGEIGEWQDQIVPEGVTLKQIWDKFWDDADMNGFTLEYGTEQLHEAIDDWMRESNFLVSLDDDGWLDDVSDPETN